MSPVSRQSRPPSLKKLYAHMVAAFDTLGPDSDPLDAELLASTLHGMWLANGEDDDMDTIFGLGVVEYAAQKATPSALALLRTWAVVGVTAEQREAAAAAASELSAAGLADPSWAVQLGQLRVGECWQLSDVYGDQAELVCTFHRGGADHAIVALVEFDRTGLWLRSVFLVDDIPATLAELRKHAGEDPLLELTQPGPAQARGLLERALAATEALGVLKSDEEMRRLRALVLARCRAMPAAPERPAGSSGTVDQQAIVAEFLASPYARELPPGPKTREIVELLVDHGVRADPERPLRISPTRVAELFDVWRHEEAELYVAAWTMWTAERAGLPEPAIAELAAAVRQEGSAAGQEDS